MISFASGFICDKFVKSVACLFLIFYIFVFAFYFAKTLFASGLLTWLVTCRTITKAVFCVFVRISFIKRLYID